MVQVSESNDHCQITLHSRITSHPGVTIFTSKRSMWRRRFDSCYESKWGAQHVEKCRGEFRTKLQYSTRRFWIEKKYICFKLISMYVPLQWKKYIIFSIQNYLLVYYSFVWNSFTFFDMLRYSKLPTDQSIFFRIDIRLSTTSRRSRTGKRGHKTIVWYTILLKLQNRMCIYLLFGLIFVH